MSKSRLLRRHGHATHTNTYARIDQILEDVLRRLLRHGIRKDNAVQALLAIL